MKKSIHLVSFDNPYPPNYGGVIDVFYKIKKLHKLGVDIILHINVFDTQNQQPELEKYCKKIYYYKRKNNFLSLFSILPFRVKSRSNYQLTINLKSETIPIIFEGLHSIYPLLKFNFKDAYIRTHNIEHKYFFELSKSEKNIFKKALFYVEAIKLRRIETNLKRTKGIFTISPIEQRYFLSKFGLKSKYIPAFHEAKKNNNLFSKGNFILYHGNLNVSENVTAAMFLIDVYKNSEFNLVIAGTFKNKLLLREINKHDNIVYNPIPNQEELDKLFAQAHINILITFQNTGIKLKLLNTLYKGKFIIANKFMVEKTGLEKLCKIANNKQEILAETLNLFKKEFSSEEILERELILKEFNPETSAQKIIDIIFN
ncbi:hypothetical protein LPB136_13350 [Tenacibaculum todarodis]|uniref:Mannosyltransferase n=1 Tax=Tenacibaculum todarodis TaxID=1850252 RepID=A0A1L3JFE1_9FLAO|nr:hypothetical protein [Tenacibaculum todarodis]APG63858.1 hypothetical protein LPB136_00060 [Tenacibaculum todarodis]APG66297.1 hypothetical protein LPB136_13350 [Tenacibaculum todarodis]